MVRSAGATAVNSAFIGHIQQSWPTPSSIPALPQQTPNQLSPLCGLPQPVQTLPSVCATPIRGPATDNPSVTQFHSPSPSNNEDIGAQLQDSIDAMLNNGAAAAQSSGMSHAPSCNKQCPQTDITDPIEKKKVKERQRKDPGPGNRTVEIARSHAKDFLYQPPPHFPIGPFDCKNLSVLCNTINAYTNTPSCPLGGGFQVGPVRPQKDGERVVRESFRCKGCKWEATYELTTEGWLMVRYAPHKDVIKVTSAEGEIGERKVVHSNHHSSEHILDLTFAEVAAQRGGRSDVPKDLQAEAAKLVESGLPPKAVLQYLNDQASRRNVEMSLDYGWVYRRYYTRTPQTTALDLSKLMETLQQRKDEYGLGCEIWLDSLGYTERVFCELHGAKEHWARCPKSNVLLFDPTFGTNRHGLKLCCFVSISATGRNTILAFVLIEVENKETFEWSF